MFVGRAEERGVVDFSVDAGERDLLAVVGRLGLDSFAMYNHLMAGEVPLGFAARHPSRVRSVVCLAQENGPERRSPTLAQPVRRRNCG